MKINETKEKLSQIFKCDWKIVKGEIKTGITTQPKGKWNNKTKETTHRMRVNKTIKIYFVVELNTEKEAFDMSKIFQKYGIAVNSGNVKESKYWEIKIHESSINLFLFRFNEKFSVWQQIQIFFLINFKPKKNYYYWKKMYKIKDYNNKLDYVCGDCNEIFEIHRNGEDFLIIKEGDSPRVSHTKFCPYCKSKNIKRGK